MSVNLNTLPAELIQYHVLDNLKLQEAVALAGVDTYLRKNVREATQLVAKNRKIDFVEVIKGLYHQKSLLQDEGLADNTAVIDAGRKSSQRREWYFLHQEQIDQEEGAFDALQSNLSRELEEHLAPFVRELLPSLPNDRDFYLSLAKTCLKSHTADFFQVFRRRVHLLINTKIHEIQSARRVWSSFQSNQRGNNAALFPQAKLQSFANIDGLVHNFESLRRFLNELRTNNNELLDFEPERFLRGLFNMEDVTGMDYLLGRVYKLELTDASAEYLSLRPGLGFLAKFTNVTTLILNCGHLKALPRSILNLPIQSLDIRGNQFTTLPLVPRTMKVVDFAYNPIDPESEGNNNVHALIKAIIPALYEVETGKLEMQEQRELADAMFKDVLDESKISKWYQSRGLQHKVRETRIFLKTYKVMDAYVAASQEVQREDS